MQRPVRRRSFRSLLSRLVHSTGSILVFAVLFLVGGFFLTRGNGEGAALGGAAIPSAPGGSFVETILSSPWYLSPGGYLVIGLLGIGIVFVLVWWRTSYLQRKREQLERQVAERTNEVRRQKQQLEAYNHELLRTNEQLRRTIEEKSKLLGVAAHDLKNPLFGIRALSEIVLESEALSDRGERKLNLIRESAEESLHLIDDLLATAASSARAGLDPEPVDVKALVQWVVHSFEPQAERKGQDLRCSIPDEKCVVRGDKRKLREAVANLVSNALKYSPPGEAVDVFVNRRNGAVQVAVEDDGPGLSKTDQERMFAPFQRLGPTPTGDESSSGLGLYIVKQVVDLHDGSIDVTTAPGEGSTFTLRLPIVVSDDSFTSEADPPATAIPN